VLREPANHGQKSARTNTKNEINDDGRDGTKMGKKEEGCVGDRLISSEKGNIGKPLPPPLL
jgi:hypothetical protein